MLTMFVYGTLKRGERNHERFCSGALHVEEGAVRGVLYDLPLFGYPELIVPEESVHAFGTDDPAGDAEPQERMAHGYPLPLEGPLVFGEDFLFDDAVSRLPAIDLLPACLATRRTERRPGAPGVGLRSQGAYGNVPPGRDVAAPRRLSEELSLPITVPSFFSHQRSAPSCLGRTLIARLAQGSGVYSGGSRTAPTG